jgi:hypothetical protein
MKKALIIIGCVLLALGIVCGVVALRVHKKLNAEPKIEAVVVSDSTIVCGACADPVMCFLSLSEDQEGMGTGRLDAYKYLSGAELYRLELHFASFHKEDTLLGSSICFYYEQRDSIVYDSSKAPEFYMRSSPWGDKPSDTKMLFYCYKTDYLDDLFAQPITEIGLNTSNRGLVKFPMRKKATEQFAQRLALLKEYIAQY